MADRDLHTPSALALRQGLPWGAERAHQVVLVIDAWRAADVARWVRLLDERGASAALLLDPDRVDLAEGLERSELGSLLGLGLAIVWSGAPHAARLAGAPLATLRAHLEQCVACDPDERLWALAPRPDRLGQSADVLVASEAARHGARWLSAGALQVPLPRSPSGLLLTRDEVARAQAMPEELLGRPHSSSSGLLQALHQARVVGREVSQVWRRR